MRGNHAISGVPPSTRGSIPAYAGEPLTRKQSGLYMGVYPRVCGGTKQIARAVLLPCGLSPRMRGNPATGIPDEYDTGSIPAYAGEPAGRNRFHRVRQVYPRVCGGTSSAKA